MGGGQVPGPICNIVRWLGIDEGTSCRHKSPSQASVGLAPRRADPSLDHDISRLSSDLPDEVLMEETCLPDLKYIQSVNARFRRRRPAGTVIDEIVIHDTDSKTTKFENTLRYLENPGDGRMVSIHFLIGREHGKIVAMVPEEERANHAPNHNARSIGIELWRRKGDTGDFTDWQYKVLAQLVYDLIRRHRIRRTRIIGHGFFQRNRKGEPHGFDWARLDDLLDDINRRVKDFDPQYAAF
jgi:N-acetyl-anhydromuramyl-L-alanine amidase AmpD